MNRSLSLVIFGLLGSLVTASAAQAQQRPYIGFIYPAGGRQGTTFQIQLGGQGLDNVNQALVSGSGVSAKVVEYHRRLDGQDMTLLREQVIELKQAKKEDEDALKLIARIEKRMAETVNPPACASIAAVALVEVSVADDAPPGPRELRLVTPRGVSNPLVFCISQLPEHCRKPMITAKLSVLGKEQLSLRKRPAEEVEDRLEVPCIANGQIASGEVNRYRFSARKGQHLVISTAARQLIPFIADAVPGWFQPVLALYDAEGKEVAYDDDYRFKPDPIILYEVPKEGDYVLEIHDALYRGREDFVYRISIGEMPFVTSIFPLGGKAGEPSTVEMKGWNLENIGKPTLPLPEAPPGVYSVFARDKKGFVSNRLPFALDVLPECFEHELNDDPPRAQKMKLPVIVNGCIDRRGDVDVFQFAGRAGDSIVAEVHARRLDSPLDSVLALTDAAGKLLAFNDDREDASSGLNTHHADSYLAAKLPADGTYFVRLGDTSQNGGEEYAYRLRLGAPQPDFALRMTPSSIALRSKSNAVINVQVIRQDGFAGPVKLNLKNPPAGFTSLPCTLPANQDTARLVVKTDLQSTKEPVAICIEGRAKMRDREVVHEAVPVEDRMQAFLWRHLVPAEEMKALVFDPSQEPSAKRERRPRPPSTEESKPSAATADPAAKPKFTKQQIAGRLRQLKLLFEERLLTDDFNDRRIAECEAAQ